MSQLTTSDSHHLIAAIGWIELGNIIEANEELERIAPGLHAHPDVLEVRWQIYATEEKWGACLDLADAILTLDFNRVHGWIHKAVSLHKLSRTNEAYEHLENAADMFPENWMVRYHLACYACQLRRNRETWEWLVLAIELGDANAVKLMALDEPLLEPFWTEISEI